MNCLVDSWMPSQIINLKLIVVSAFIRLAFFSPLKEEYVVRLQLLFILNCVCFCSALFTTCVSRSLKDNQTNMLVIVFKFSGFVKINSTRHILGEIKGILFEFMLAKPSVPLDKFDYAILSQNGWFQSCVQAFIQIILSGFSVIKIFISGLLGEVIFSHHPSYMDNIIKSSSLESLRRKSIVKSAYVHEKKV